MRAGGTKKGVRAREKTQRQVKQASRRSAENKRNRACAPTKETATKQAEQGLGRDQLRGARRKTRKKCLESTISQKTRQGYHERAGRNVNGRAIEGWCCLLLRDRNFKSLPLDLAPVPGELHRKSSLLKTPFSVPKFGTQCGPIQKYWTALCSLDCMAMAKKLTSADLRR